jgi:hypothetical protein
MVADRSFWLSGLSIATWHSRPVLTMFPNLSPFPSMLLSSLPKPSCLLMSAGWNTFSWRRSSFRNLASDLSSERIVAVQRLLSICHFSFKGLCLYKGGSISFQNACFHVSISQPAAFIILLFESIALLVYLVSLRQHLIDSSVSSPVFFCAQYKSSSFYGLA